MSLLLPRRNGAGLLIGLAAASAAGILCTIAGFNVLYTGPVTPVVFEWPLPVGTARLALDGLSAWFLIVLGVVAVPASVYSWGYFAGSLRHGLVETFAPLWCIMVAGVILVVSAADVVVFLIGWELMSLAAFFLVGFHDRESETRRGAWMYLVATHLSMAIGLLPMFAGLVARSGSTAFSGFGHAFGASDTGWCVALFVLGVIGFGTKAGFMPFHVWLPAAHPVAPSPVSALMSGVLIKTGIYGLLRLLSWLPASPVSCGIGLMILAIITGVMGILYALGQHQIKRMLAYSSVENIGIIGIGVSLGMLGRSLGQPSLMALGFGGALLHVLNHSLFKGLLFLSAGAVIHDAGTGQIERLGGLARRTPANAILFLIGAVAICALPPLNGFLSEFLIYKGLLNGLVELSSVSLTVTIIATGALALIGGLALVGFSKLFAVVFLGEARDSDVVVHQTPVSMKVGILLLAMGCAGVSGGAASLGPLLGAALRPVMTNSVIATSAIHDSLTTLGRVAVPLGVLVIITVSLVVARRQMPQGAPADGSGRTWGCGFARPAARMQYTGSSYTWSLIQSFREFLRSRRIGALPSGCFPKEERLSTQTLDFVLERGYEPTFKGLASFFERLWPLQHGRIQLYLVYIVATVVIAFLVEATFGPHGQTTSPRNAPTVVRQIDSHQVELQGRS